MKRSLSTARNFLVFVEFIGWTVIACGAFFIFWSIAQSAPQGIMIGAGLCVGGIFQIVFTQIARAQVETAENSAIAVELLHSIKNTLQGPARTLDGGGRPPTLDMSFMGENQQGRRIQKDSSGRYIVGEQVFVNLAEAEQAMGRTRSA